MGWGVFLMSEVSLYSIGDPLIIGSYREQKINLKRSGNEVYYAERSLSVILK